ncbi:MAG: MFS transporter [Streptosporangiales bacterium]|nr:MFS transporter [Streptosporangiales bacterium]
MYPVYALLFAETGLSPAEISSLFVIWSVTAFTLEIPSGAWADRFSRRLLVTASPACAGTGFALWTFFPSYPAFTAGFVLWGAGGALRSGALQALVYEELRRLGRAGSYARLIGRSEALGTTAVMLSTALTSPVLAFGGYQAVGIASVAATAAATLAALSLPESRGRPEPGTSYLRVLRAGITEVRGTKGVPRLLGLVAVLSGVDAMDEYLPLLAQATGVPTPAVPLLLLVVSAGSAVGGWLAGRGTRFLVPVIFTGGVSLAAGALIADALHPSGMVLVAVTFGIFSWANAAADAALQDSVGDDARATVTSVAGFGIEVVAVLIFAGYAFGSTWLSPGPLFAIAAIPYVLIATGFRHVARAQPATDEDEGEDDEPDAAA